MSVKFLNWPEIQESLWSTDAWTSTVWILVLGGLIGLLCGVLGCLFYSYVAWHLQAMPLATVCCPA